MIRSDREIKDKDAIEAIIRRCQVVHVGMSKNDQPYVVPMNFGYTGDAVYLHSLARGKKIETLKQNSKVCLLFDIPGEVVEEEKACHWGMKYESVVGYGTAEILESEELKKEGLTHIMRQYSDREWEFGENALKKISVIRIAISEIHGKAHT